MQRNRPLSRGLCHAFTRGSAKPRPFWEERRGELPKGWPKRGREAVWVGRRSTEQIPGKPGRQSLNFPIGSDPSAPTARDDICVTARERLHRFLLPPRSLSWSRTYQIRHEGQVDHAENRSPDVQSHVVQGHDVVHHEVDVNAADQEDQQATPDLPEPASQSRARRGEAEGTRRRSTGTRRGEACPRGATRRLPRGRESPPYLQSVGKVVHDAGQAGERQDGDQSEWKLRSSRKDGRIRSGNRCDYLSADQQLPSDGISPKLLESESKGLSLPGRRKRSHSLADPLRLPPADPRPRAATRSAQRLPQTLRRQKLKYSARGVFLRDRTTQNRALVLTWRLMRTFRKSFMPVRCSTS